MTFAVAALAVVVVVLAVLVVILVRMILRRRPDRIDRHIVLGVLSTDETIVELRAAVDDLAEALAEGETTRGRSKELQP